MKIEDVKCPRCGCRRFWRVKETEQMMVDFSREGAITGAPFLEGTPQNYHNLTFRCAECDSWMLPEVSKQMEALIL